MSMRDVTIGRNEPDVDYTLKGPIKVSLNVASGAAGHSKLASVNDESNDDDVSSLSQHIV
jgi:hypothetical protein